MIHFVRTDKQGWVRGYFPVPDLDDPDLGPTGYLLPCPPGFKYELVNGPFAWNPPTVHHDAFRLANGDIEWVDLLELETRRAAAIDTIDAAGEALRLAVINRMPTQTEEYRQALAQAEAWRAAGYVEDDEHPAPVDVASWAMAKWREGWTNRQAAEDILRTAENWAAVISKIRLLRLVNKEDVRSASTAAEILAVVADMQADMRIMAAQLNLALGD